MKHLKPLAVFGSGSDVGKSIIGAGLCRYFADQGFNVAPFKAQNMSNNSGITPEGLEMGRAQIVQAEACRIPPHVDMNPVLLKPTGEMGSQVVLMGQAVENSTAAAYHGNKDRYFTHACQAFDRLRQRHDLIVLEGAGSCAEVNLMASDIVNFRMAEYADANVILVADIHRGGVFAQIVGTLECLPQSCRDRIRGFIINRFRGDITLFKDGCEWIEKKTGKPVFGVVPWYHHFRIDAEDSVEIETCPSLASLDPSKPAVAVIRLRHISNFTDLHALSASDSVQVIFMEKPSDLSRFQAVIIPGSKNTRGDLDWISATGWNRRLQEYADNGGHILGICGGYQILGEYVDDPHGLEDQPGRTPGLNLLPVRTTLKAPKTTTLSSFSWGETRGEGYEIHMGSTIRLSGNSFCDITMRNGQACAEADGCISETGTIVGTYIHGLFDTPQILYNWLKFIKINQLPTLEMLIKTSKESNYGLLKTHCESNLDMDAIKGLIGESSARL